MKDREDDSAHEFEGGDKIEEEKSIMQKQTALKQSAQMKLTYILKMIHKLVE